jgi:two-component system NtrC family sensor kinase
MKSLIKICLLLLPFFVNGQEVTILDTTLNNQWTRITKDWRYQKGDNKEWANPKFDDSSWKQFSSFNLNVPDGKNAIADYGEIVWFRKKIKKDSSLNKAIVLNIPQFGASEIYLDGKLIHQLGKLSTDINKVIYYNPKMQMLELPLEKGKEQVLAVRYLNAQYKFPINNNKNGFITLAVSTLSFANSSDSSLALAAKYIKKYYITLGISILFL